MVLCRLVPQVPGRLEKADLATPRNQQVTEKTAARLRQRHARQLKVEGAPLELKAFPWNAASRACIAGTPFKPRGVDANRAGCLVCQAVNSRDCTCASHLAESTDCKKLTSFCHFVRADTTPVFEEADPDDQSKLQRALLECTMGVVHVLQVAGPIVRFAALAALSGRPETMDTLESVLKSHAPDADLVQSVTELVASEQLFFRGGQAHGSLPKASVPDALRTFLETEHGHMLPFVVEWASGGEGRISALRSLYKLAEQTAPLFGMREYWTKRFLEICLLALLGWQKMVPGVPGVSPKDFDQLADLWPVAKGTATGIKLIFPAAHSLADYRHGLRALQRALGGGTKHVPLVRISAFLCFWQGSLRES